MKTGQTITVLEDISTSNTITINKKGIKFTINFAGNLYYYKGTGNAFNVKAGNITIKSGNIKSKNYIFRVQKGANITVNNGRYVGYHYNAGKYYIKNGSFTTKGVPSSKADELLQNYGTMKITKGNFLGEDDNAVLNVGHLFIERGTFKTTAQSTNGSYPAIMNEKKGQCEIVGGVFQGRECSIWNDGGKVTIYDGTFYATKYNTIANEGTMYIEGGTFKIGNKKYFLIWNLGNMTINDGVFNGCIGNEISSSKILRINGGTVKTPNDCAVYNYKGKINITGGTFTTSKYNTIVNNSKGVLTINDGAFKCTGYYYVLSNYGKAYLKGGRFSAKGNANSILSKKGSVLQISKNVRYTGKVDYK